MEVLLKEAIPNLGERGDVVKVASGYARNYLIPQKKAVHVSKATMQLVEEEQRAIEKENRKKLDNLRTLADSLTKKSYTIETRVTEEGHLFGSVGPRQVLDVLAEDGFELKEESVVLEEHIKEVGVYSIPIKLSPEVGCEIKLWVVGK